MIKKKAKSKTAAKKPAKGKKSEAKAKPETNPAEVRKEISELVKEAAAAVAGAVIDVAKTGQLAPARYLFEMANIFPPAPDGEQATTEEDCLAKMLLARISPAKKAEGENAEAGSEVAQPAKEVKDDSAGKNPDGESAKAVEAAKEILVTV
jgi:hypothetical protein